MIGLVGCRTFNKYVGNLFQIFELSCIRGRSLHPNLVKVGCLVRINRDRFRAIQLEPSGIWFAFHVQSVLRRLGGALIQMGKIRLSFEVELQFFMYPILQLFLRIVYNAHLNIFKYMLLIVSITLLQGYSRSVLSANLPRTKRQFLSSSGRCLLSTGESHTGWSLREWFGVYLGHSGCPTANHELPSA